MPCVFSLAGSLEVWEQEALGGGLTRSLLCPIRAENPPVLLSRPSDLKPYASQPPQKRTSRWIIHAPSIRGKIESPPVNAAMPERRPATAQTSGVIERVTFHNDDIGFWVLGLINGWVGEDGRAAVRNIVPRLLSLSDRTLFVNSSGE